MQASRRNEPPRCPHQAILEAYHRLLPALPQVLVSRWPGSVSSRHLAARWREGWRAGRQDGFDPNGFAFRTTEEGLACFEAFFQRVAASRFLTGGSSRGWRADLHWLLLPSNFLKVLEGRYDDADSAHAAAPGKRRHINDRSAEEWTKGVGEDGRF